MIGNEIDWNSNLEYRDVWSHWSFTAHLRVIDAFHAVCLEELRSLHLSRSRDLKRQQTAVKIVRWLINVPPHIQEEEIWRKDSVNGKQNEDLLRCRICCSTKHGSCNVDESRPRRANCDRGLQFHRWSEQSADRTSDHTLFNFKSLGWRREALRHIDPYHRTPFDHFPPDQHHRCIDLGTMSDWCTARLSRDIWEIDKVLQSAMNRSLCRISVRTDARQGQEDNPGQE